MRAYLWASGKKKEGQGWEKRYRRSAEALEVQPIVIDDGEEGRCDTRAPLSVLGWAGKGAKKDGSVCGFQIMCTFSSSKI